MSRWFSVYIAFQVRGHKTQLHGLTSEAWTIGRNRPMRVVEIILQLIRRVCFFAQDTGFIKPGKDWVDIYNELAESCKSIARYYEDMSKEREVK